MGIFVFIKMISINIPKIIRTVRQESFNNINDRRCILLFRNIHNIQNIDNQYANTEIVSYSKEARKFIDENWKNKLSLNNNIFNGELINVDSIEYDNLHINLKLSKTDYKSFVGTACKKYFADFSTNEPISTPLTVSGFIETADNKIVMGPRGNSKLLQIAGGMLDPINDIVDNKLNFTHCIERENSEELCKLDIYDYKFIGITLHCFANFVTILYSAKCKQTYNEIKLLHNRDNKSISDFNELPTIDYVDTNKNSLENIVLSKNMGDKRFIWSTFLGLKMFYLNKYNK